MMSGIAGQFQVRNEICEVNESTVCDDLGQRSVHRALEAVERALPSSSNLLLDRQVSAVFGSATHFLPRYIFAGPKGGDEPLKIGFFAGIHGDEPEGVHALVRFIMFLEEHPKMAAGYCLFFYPICSPSAFEQGTRHAPSGKDLNREFWRGSREPEVLLLESELRKQQFSGLVSLHTDDGANGFYGFAHGATITRHLLEPALCAAEEFVPRNNESLIDGFKARAGIISEGYHGILSAPPGVRPRPFEITLETPKGAPEYLKEAAFVAGLQAILNRYREFMAYAPNL
jgi:murein peptide amidase A